MRSKVRHTITSSRYLSSTPLLLILVVFQIVGEMFAGDSFGELALLHDMKRAATIICKGTAEFLTVDKPDFNMVHDFCFTFIMILIPAQNTSLIPLLSSGRQVLKKGHQQEWETRISLLKSLPYFNDYTTKELEQLNTTAKLVEYPQNTVRGLGNNL